MASVKIQNVPIDKLIKCRYSNNLEFLQWIKKYWDAFYPGGKYNALARRNGSASTKPQTPLQKSSTAASATRLSAKTNSALKERAESVVSFKPTSTASRSRRGSESSVGSNIMGKTMKSSTANVNQISSRSASSAVLKKSQSAARFNNDQRQSQKPKSDEHLISELKNQVADLKVAADTLERERNFYYLKLRDLEVLVLEKLESAEQLTFVQDIQAILYATEEGFIRPGKNTTQKLEPTPISISSQETKILNLEQAQSRETEVVSVGVNEFEFKRTDDYVPSHSQKGSRRSSAPFISSRSGSSSNCNSARVSVVSGNPTTSSKSALMFVSFRKEPPELPGKSSTGSRNSVTRFSKLEKDDSKTVSGEFGMFGDGSGE
ncbi:hypothetical protein HK100_000527 [Physocladia obscura]|uniref:EB1 C-terminal domain-containing protein n=1 Tax=Physocladia obscura TaxID=109957 RepID=A0AAD5SYI3_9FUNG|nr:hypothetical protein HK100_000527 [Physocladia obscura]